MNIISWTAFKSLVSSKGLLIQYTENTNTYDLYAIESNAFMWYYSLLMDSGSDQIDFETNFKSTANAPLEIKAASGRPLRVSASPQPMNTVEHWQGYQITVPVGQSSGYVDVSFANSVYVHGGYIVSPDVDFSDYVGVDVLLVANSAEYIPGIISTAYMIPNLPVSFESYESMQFPPAVKFRVTLTLGDVHTADTHANILINYFE